MLEVADIMVRTSKTIKEALTEVGVGMTTAEAESLLRKRAFQSILRAARLRFDLEVASDPARSKQSTIGRLQNLADKLLEIGEFDKAAEVLFKLAKLENWIGEGGSVNVFAGLTQADLDEMRAKIVAAKPASVEDKLN